MPVITVDGPAAVGKGTVARTVAAALGFAHLDSGRFYRAVGHAARAAGAELDDELAVLAAAAATLADADALRRALASPTLAGERSGAAASQVAQLPGVRDAVSAAVRGWVRPPGVVADGRDMGTLVFPTAMLKIFLDARLATRERRASARAAGVPGATIRDSLGEFRVRNARDSNRRIAPVEPDPAAEVIVTDDLGVDAVAAHVVALFRRRQEAGGVDIHE